MSGDDRRRERYSLVKSVFFEVAALKDGGCVGEYTRPLVLLAMGAALARVLAILCFWMGAVGMMVA